jgi:hypothetical protein
MGRPRRKRAAFNPFQKLDSEWKARQAARTTAAAVGVIAVTHVFSALYWVNGGNRLSSALISSDPRVLTLFSAALALIAVVASYVANRTSPLWLAWVVLGWSVLEVLPWITAPLYGHGAVGKLAGLALVCALIGLRGARALKRGFASDVAVFT